MCVPYNSWNKQIFFLLYSSHQLGFLTETQHFVCVLSVYTTSNNASLRRVNHNNTVGSIQTKQAFNNKWIQTFLKLISIFLNFCTVHFCSMFMNNQQMHWFFSSLLFYSATPACFDTYVSSSGSSSVPAELYMNWMQWLIRLCVIRYYVSVMWRPSVHRSVRLRCQVRTHSTT
jgi:hypothetical protein